MTLTAGHLRALLASLPDDTPLVYAPPGHPAVLPLHTAEVGSLLRTGASTVFVQDGAQAEQGEGQRVVVVRQWRGSWELPREDEASRTGPAET